MKSIIAIILATTLTACGGGGGSTASAPPPQTSPVVTVCAPTRIQLFGDSTQYGIDGTDRVSRAALYPELALQKAMDQAYGYGKVIVSTRAVPATTSTDLFNGTDGLNKSWPQSVDADIVVMNHGTNDDLKNTGIEQYKANLRILARAPAIVVFETHIPDFHRDNGYADAMRQVATELHMPLIDTNAYAKSMPSWDQYVPDYVHPNSDGYSLIARNVKMPVLTSIVNNLRKNCGQ
jgi:lysophospholipase L1-like esterase